MGALERRRNLPTTALAVLDVDWPDCQEPPVISALRAWLNSWSGVGHILAGMNAQDHDLELRQFPHGWGATFYPSGRAHSIIAGFGWASTAWAAVQKAALEALHRVDESRRTDAHR